MLICVCVKYDVFRKKYTVRPSFKGETENNKMSSKT